MHDYGDEPVDFYQGGWGAPQGNVKNMYTDDSFETFPDISTSYMVADYSLECKKDGRMSAARIGWVVYAILMN